MDKRRVWRRDEIVEAEIGSITFEGQGVARVDGTVIFVRGALPGDVVRARLTKVKTSFCEGEAVSIVRPSAWRVEPRCRHVGVCGGCVCQGLRYDKQLAYKAANVRESLERIGGLSLDVRPRSVWLIPGAIATRWSSPLARPTEPRISD